VFPGAVAPDGMLAWSPDTTSAIRGGYSYLDDTITGFSLTHFGGRGCAYKGDVPFKPVAGPVTDSPGTGSRCNASFAHAAETAACAKLRVGLDSGPGTATTPVWLKLKRDGSTFIGYYSTNGTDWTRVGSVAVPGATGNEDVGRFSTSNNPPVAGHADFTGFQVGSSNSPEGRSR
jgi:Glycosyl hydrolase family 92 N-terminal domain